MEQKNIGTDRALEKIKHYCSYQERSHQEVKDKLYSFGLYPGEVEELLSQLISENYLNEERYAIAFAGGKFRAKHWGRIKIRYALKLQRVSDYCIKKALAIIDERDYEQLLDKLAQEKLRTLRSEKNIFIKKKKIQSFLQQRGFENELISEWLKKL
ncbi:MAG TPA: RecX family transcriptional regulator [Ferruginibacter sp.]|nr:RecX family transcriptional regulator [Ferruginibacter sp.]